MNNNTVDWDMQYRLCVLTLTCNSIMQLLIAKGIITADEVAEEVEKERNFEDVKSNIDKIEILRNIQSIEKKDTLSKEDEKYIRENGIKVDTNENVDFFINTLKSRSTFNSLFGNVFSTSLFS